MSNYTRVFHYATLVWQTTTLVLQPTAASALMVAGVPCRKSRLCDGCSSSVIAVHSSSCDVPSRQAAALSAQTTSAPPRARLTCSPVAASAALLAPLRRLSTSSATQGGSSPASSEKAGAMRQRLCGILVVPIHRCPRERTGGRVLALQRRCAAFHPGYRGLPLPKRESC